MDPKLSLSIHKFINGLNFYQKSINQFYALLWGLSIYYPYNTIPFRLLTVGMKNCDKKMKSLATGNKNDLKALKDQHRMTDRNLTNLF